MTPDPTWDPTEFRETISAYLDRHGLSQNQLAEISGVSQAVINRWFQDGRPQVQPTDKTLRRLAPVLAVPLNELMRQAGRTEADPRAKHRSPDHAAVVRDLDAVWDHLEPLRRDIIRSMLNLHAPRRPNRRNRRNGQGSTPDAPEAFGRITYAQLKTA